MIPGTRCRTDAICPPEDEHNSARNIQRSIIDVIKNLCAKLIKKTIITTNSLPKKCSESEKQSKLGDGQLDSNLPDISQY